MSDENEPYTGQPLKNLCKEVHEQFRRDHGLAPTMSAIVPLAYCHVHVKGVEVGPSEMRCKQCGFFMLPYEPEEAHDLAAFLDCTNDCTQEYASIWACFSCARAVVVTW